MKFWMVRELVDYEIHGCFLKKRDAVAFARTFDRCRIEVMEMAVTAEAICELLESAAIGGDEVMYFDDDGVQS